MKTSTRLALPFFYVLLASACSDNDNYPKEYIGFEQQSVSHTYDMKNDEETLTLKIIAGDKQDTDRKLTIGSPVRSDGFRIRDLHPVMLKGKKAVTLDITLYPKKINGIHRVIRLTCTPDGKDAKVSEIAIHLQKK